MLYSFYSWMHHIKFFAWHIRNDSQLTQHLITSLVIQCILTEDWAMLKRRKTVKIPCNWSSMKLLSNYHKQIVINSLCTNWMNIRMKPKIKIENHIIIFSLVLQTNKLLLEFQKFSTKCDKICYQILWIFYQLATNFSISNNFDSQNWCKPTWLEWNGMESIALVWWMDFMHFNVQMIRENY